MERLKVIGFISAVSLALEACSPVRATPEEAAKDFADALINGDTNRALTLAGGANTWRNQGVAQYWTEVASAMRGCKIDQVAKGTGASNTKLVMNVNFKEPCGQSQSKFTGMRVSVNKTRDGAYYVDPLFTLPIKLPSSR